MITTINIMSERCQRLLSGGYISDSDRVKLPEIKLAVQSSVNSALKTEMFKVTYALDGESIPDGVILATYDKVPVTRGTGNTAIAKLPVTPMMLPERMGIFSVYPTGYPEREYIPLPSGTFNQIVKGKLINPIHRRVYTWDSGRVTVFDDLIGAGIFSVDLKLAVYDYNNDPDAPLPLSPELEGQVINEVLALFRQENPTRRDEDSQPQNIAR